MPIEATNNFVIIIRDEVVEEKGGMFIPGKGREKPHQGTILSVGELTEDKKIQEGRKALFHKGIGFEIEYEGQTYLYLTDREVISIVK